MISSTQMIPSVLNIINEETVIYEKGASITDRSKIPDTTQIPIENPNHWFKIPNVISCFVDLTNFTKLSAKKYPVTTAKIVRYFTNTAVRIYDEFESPYIDIKGDGVFALFDGEKPHLALASTVSFKTFVANDFKDKVKKIAGIDFDLNIQSGIDVGTVLVRKVGFKKRYGRSDRQNEVWAGKPVNMSSKLASLSEYGSILVSDRYYSLLKSEKSLKTCGCPNNIVEDLWKEKDLTDYSNLDFNKGYMLSSNWCLTHGQEYCNSLIRIDS